MSTTTRRATPRRFTSRLLARRAMADLSPSQRPAPAAPPGSVSPEERFRSTKYFGSLDGLRALAIVAVVWHHTTGPERTVDVAERGFLGVDMFFVLSGFLITTILLRETERTGDISLRRFYARRSLRIFPLYYGLVLASFAGSYVMSGFHFEGVRESIVPLLLYMVNWFPTASLFFVAWSLAAEEQFYLVWPPLQKLLGFFALIPLGLFVVANQLVNFGFLFADQREGMDMLEITFTPICFGVFAAYLLNYRFAQAWAVLGHRLAAPLSGLILIGLLVLPSDETSLVGMHRLAIHVLMTTWLITLVIREDHVLAGLLKLPMLVRLGVVSYGMYLFHMFVIHVVVEMLGVLELSVTLFVAVTVATYVVSEISFRLFEQPILRRKPA